MKRILKAYGWWLLGAASSVALAWLYHRRLAGDFDGLGLKLDIDEEPAPTLEEQ